MSQISTPRSPSLPCLHDDVRTRVWFEHGCLVRENYQPSRNAVLEGIKQRRNDGVNIDAPFGRCMLTIPQHDYQRLIKAYPALNSHDTVEQTKAWKRFLRSPESEAYRNY